jgi:small conductance mechanosensitive channel
MTQTNTFTRYFNNLDWEKMGQHLMSRILIILLVTVLFMVLMAIGRVIINHSFKRYKKHSIKVSNRTNTIQTLTLNIFRYTCFFFYLYAILSLIGVPVGTLIAGAGIFSIALGLGAQGFVSDVVTGFFIILEQQIDVGDSVQIGTIKGTVTAIGIRTTQVTSFDGTLNFIPNRNITIVSNYSRNHMKVNVDIHIDGTTPIDQLQATIKKTNQQIVNQFEQLKSQPEIIGPVTTDQNKLVFRVSFFTVQGAQQTLQSAFLAAYLENIQEAGITLPTEKI